jgi:hypothetical protein
MLKVQVINRIDFPKITLQEDLEEIAENIIIHDIKTGIASRMAINGGSLPANDPKTSKRKGHDKPLIDTGELKESFSFKRVGKSKVVVYIDSGRSKIAGYLQNDGVKTNFGVKHYRFFGISNNAFDRAMQYANNKIREITSGNRSRTK